MLELLKGVKDAYHNADLAGKHKFLEVMVDRIALRDGQVFVHWQTPFQTLFDLGEMFINKGMWGETLYKYVSTVWHVDIGARLDRLAELNQIYLAPQACPA